MAWTNSQTIQNDMREQLFSILNMLLLNIRSLRQQYGQGNIEVPQNRLVELETLTLQALDYAHMATTSSVIEQPLTEALSVLVEESAERLHASSRISVSGNDDATTNPDRALSPQCQSLLLILGRAILTEIEQHSNVRRIRLIITHGEETFSYRLEDDGYYPTAKNSSQEIEDNVMAPLPFTQTSSQTTVAPLIQDLLQQIKASGGRIELQYGNNEHGTTLQVQVPYGLQTHITSQHQVNIPQNQNELDASTSSRLRILLVIPQAVIRAGLHHLLENYQRLQIVGEAVDSIQAVSETLELGPNIVLIDASLPQEQLLEAVRQIKQLNPDTRILLLINQDHEEFLYEALRAGVDSYILKETAPDELVRAIEAVARGEMLLQSQLAGRLLARRGETNTQSGLTTREHDVLQLVARGLRNKEIAARLFVSERTVNFHLMNIYQKFGVSSRTAAVNTALERGLITESVKRRS